MQVGEGTAELFGASANWERYPGAAFEPPACGYQRRQPEKTLLYDIVAKNLDGFLASVREASPEGEGLPRFVEREFRNYLTCGILEFGFCHVVCGQCGHSIVVGFSCKGRGFCPSCTTRRMLDTSLHLVDRVLPRVPYRQWVLAFPPQLRLRLGYERETFAAARRIVLGSIFAWQRREARREGVATPLVGAVSFAQRFASNLSMFPHLHLVVPDGVFSEGPDRQLQFRELRRPRPGDLEQVATWIARRVLRWLEQHPVENEPRDALALTQASAAEVRRRASDDPPTRRRSPLVAQVEGFSLEASRHVHEHDRAALERLCRYGLRPPLALERLKRDGDRGVVVGFKKAMADGSCGVHLSEMELMRRLAALVAPPGFHLVGYHGVFASHSKHRSRLVPQPATGTPPSSGASDDISSKDASTEPPEKSDDIRADPQRGIENPEFAESFLLAPPARDRYLSWAELMKRTRGVDVLRCERCSGRMSIRAFITDPVLAREILGRLPPAPGPPSPPS